MKRHILIYLRCPACRASLSLREDEAVHDNVVLGALLCGCGKEYPIIRSVPRFVAGVMSGLERKTAASFGYEWNAFPKIIPEFRDNFLRYIAPLDRSFFLDTRVLDVGCGAGRHAYFMAEFGAREVFAIDASDAVDAAYANLQEVPSAHVIQADLHALPFEEGFFDAIFSIGVLHHLPNPEVGFRALVPFVRSGGMLSIWVYGHKYNFSNVYAYEALRIVTRRLPHRLMYLISYVPAGIVHALNSIQLIFARVPCFRRFADAFPFSYYARFPFSVKHNDAFDVLTAPKSTYWRKEEIEAWYARMGFARCSVAYLRKKSLSAYGTR